MINLLPNPPLAGGGWVGVLPSTTLNGNRDLLKIISRNNLLLQENNNDMNTDNI